MILLVLWVSLLSLKGCNMRVKKMYLLAMAKLNNEKWINMALGLNPTLSKIRVHTEYKDCPKNVQHNIKIVFRISWALIWFFRSKHVLHDSWLVFDSVFEWLFGKSNAWTRAPRCYQTCSVTKEKKQKGTKCTNTICKKSLRITIML